MAQGDAAGLTRWPSRLHLVRPDLSKMALPGLIALLSGLTALVEPKFASPSNAANLASQIAPLLILSVGQAFAIISGGLDLSVASVMSVSGVVGVLAMPHVGIVCGALLMTVTGAMTGLLSGFVIGVFDTTPLIVTLGMMSIAQAVALIFANGVPIYDVPSPFTDAIGFGTVMGFPVTTGISVIVAVVASLVLRRTLLGRYIYAIGSNRSAAVKSGLNVRMTTMLVYGASGLASGIAGVVMTAWTGAAQPVGDPSLGLRSLAAVVLGGVTLTGGSGGMIQVVYGVLILTILSNGMNMLGISSYYQTFAVGVVIILAVILDRIRRT